MKSIQIFIAIFAMVFIVQTSHAQNYANDFSWVTGPSNTNMTGAASCGGQNNITLTSSPSTHTSSGTSVIFPSVTATDPTNVITIQLDFSTPVCNLRLKVNDIDQDIGNIPAETVVTSPAFDAIAPSFAPPGPLFTAGGATLFPGGLNNTLGWVEFNGPLTSVTLTYNRSGIGFGILLDSIMYECCENCICDSEDNKLIGATSSIPSSGAASVGLNVNSAGVPISKLNISLPYYQSLADPDCIKCDPENISSYGKITNLPMIAGVSPTATGFSSDGAAEIVYEFGTPTVIDETISLDLQFPPTLDLSCCSNKVDYCIKLGLIDANCRICEKLLCLKSSSTGGPTGSGGSSSRLNTSTHSNPNEIDQIGNQPSSNDQLKLILHPNPTKDLLNIKLPSSQSATLEVFNLNGQLIQSENIQKENYQLNASELSQGTYLLKYSLGDTVITDKFVKQ